MGLDVGFLLSFQQLKVISRRARNLNREEIPFFSQIVPRGLSVAGGP